MSDLSSLVSTIFSLPGVKQEVFTQIVHADPNIAAGVDVFTKVSSIVTDVAAGGTTAGVLQKLLNHGTDFTNVVAEVKTLPLPAEVQTVLAGPVVTEALSFFQEFAAIYSQFGVKTS